MLKKLCTALSIHEISIARKLSVPQDAIVQQDEEMGVPAITSLKFPLPLLLMVVPTIQNKLGEL